MNQAPRDDLVRRFAASASLLQVDDSCDADTLAARATFWRTIAERRRAGGSIPPFEGALREGNLLQQIACTPTDGMAWAELAEAEHLAKGETDRTITYLALSQHYAPYEGLALRMRLRLLTAEGATQFDKAEHLLRSDLATILEYGTPQEAAGYVMRLRGSIRAWAYTHIQTLDAERQTALHSSLETPSASQAY